MPFSKDIKGQYEEYVYHAISAVKFKTAEDIADFCQTAYSKLFTDQQVSSSKYDEDINDLQELINDGFDLYATDNIVDLVNYHYSSLSYGSSREPIPAFTPARELLQNNSREAKEREVKISRDERIKEAREEFKKIIIQQIHTQLDKLFSMDETECNQYIQEQQNNKREKEQNERIMTAARAIPRTPEEKTIDETEQQYLMRETARFNNQDPASVDRNAEPAAEVPDASMPSLLSMNGLRLFVSQQSSANTSLPSRDSQIIARSLAEFARLFAPFEGSANASTQYRDQSPDGYNR